LIGCSSLTFQGTYRLKIRNTSSIISKITVKVWQGAMKKVNINIEIVFEKKIGGGNSLKLITPIKYHITNKCTNCILYYLL
jgi:hypothetical protein